MVCLGLEKLGLGLSELQAFKGCHRFTRLNQVSYRLEDARHSGRHARGHVRQAISVGLEFARGR
ncbi:hypothetical protein D3C72_2006660 [compost metagenome]